MAQVTHEDGSPVTDEEFIAVMVASGMTEEYARFVLALEKGETDGDVVAVDEDGEPVVSEVGRG